MKFMIMRKADADTEAEMMPTQAELAAMGHYNEQMVKDGVFIDGMGLKPSRYGARVDFRDGTPVVTDGPFTETRELLAGFTLFEADSKADAIERVKQWPKTDGNGNVSLELRQLFTMEDFAEGEGLDVHRKMDARLDSQPANLCPHLNFDGQCAAALHFYADALGGDVQMLMSYGESPIAGDFDENWQGKIIHGTVAIGKLLLMGCDVPPDRYRKPQGFNVQISFAEGERARVAFARLAEQGTVDMPFAETFWSPGFGMVTDRFGISWVINTDPTEGK